MRKLLIILCLLQLLIQTAVCNADSIDNDPLVAGGVAGITTALSRADVAFVRSTVVMNLLKGDFGESFAERLLLNSDLGWKPITPRVGRQGIDLVSIKYNRLGRPISLMVSEVKYGSSRLGQTKDGIQAGSNHTSKRLVALGNRYLRIANTQGIQVQPMPRRSKVTYQIRATLMNGNVGTFWKVNSKDTAWKFDGRADDLLEAQKNIQMEGTLLKAGGENIVNVRRRLIGIKRIGGNFEIRIGDASLLDDGLTQSQILKGKPAFTIPVSSPSATNEIVNNLSKHIRSNNPTLNKLEADSLARSASDILEGKNASFKSTLAVNSLKAGAVGSVFFVAMEGAHQLVAGEFDPVRLGTFAGIGFGSTSVGAYAGQKTTAELVNKKFTSLAAKRIGMTTPFFSNLAGSLCGAGVANIVFSYGGYIAGFYSLEEANLMTAIGTGGVVGGALAGSGVLAIASAYGTASTGAAIGGLNGAAANSAALAWLGGGSVASGGGGMAWGAAVVGGVVVIAAVAVVVATTYTIEIFNERDNNKYLKGLLAHLSSLGSNPFKSHVDSLFPVLTN